MNKINEISGLPSSLPAKKLNQSQTGDEFQKIFTKALEPPAAEKGAAPPLNSLGEIRLPMVNRIEEVQGDLADQTSRLLDQLEAFAQALGDPSRSLKAMEPMATDLKKSAEALSQKAVGESAQSDRLQEIAQESAMTATLEYIKFYRGDYV